MRSKEPMSKLILFPRSKYNHIGQKVVFVAATDDPKWLKANLRGRDVFFTSELFSKIETLVDNLRHSDTLRTVQSSLTSTTGGSMPDQGEDLAILSLCNHTIISVGRCQAGTEEKNLPASSACV